MLIYFHIAALSFLAKTGATLDRENARYASAKTRNARANLRFVGTSPTFVSCFETIHQSRSRLNSVIERSGVLAPTAKELGTHALQFYQVKDKRLEAERLCSTHLDCVKV